MSLLNFGSGLKKKIGCKMFFKIVTMILITMYNILAVTEGTRDKAPYSKIFFDKYFKSLKCGNHYLKILLHLIQRRSSPEYSLE